jgi:hypothetical protein
MFVSAPHGVVEEHQPELADEEVERFSGEVVGLCISNDKLGVADRCSLSTPHGQLHERPRDVEASGTLGHAGRRKRRCTGPAADVEHGLARLGQSAREESLSERFELQIVAVGVFDKCSDSGPFQASACCSFADIRAPPDR